MTEYPYGYCGMPCALCTRHRADGKSRCAGCSHGGYYTDVCKVFRCCREKGLAQCGECAEYPCERLGKMGDFRDLDTKNAKRRTSDAVASAGFESWYGAYALRAALLGEALERYNNGRMKRFICELFIQNDYAALSALMRRAEGLGGDIKERAAAFKLLAEEMLKG